MKKSIITIIALCLLSFSACAQSKASVETTMAVINITANGVTKTATLVDNSSTQALVELLKKGDITVHTDDYGNFEKVGELGTSLPRNDTPIDTVAGDLILYLGKRIVFYYSTNSWNFTRLGKLDITDEKEIREFLNAGKGPTDIIISLK